MRGLPTQVPLAGEERWLGAFLGFERVRSDPRTDVQLAAEVSDATSPSTLSCGRARQHRDRHQGALVADELLVCDVHRTNVQMTILGPDMDTSGRQAFFFAEAEAVEIASGL